MIRILVSNTPIPSKKIGSWTNRISRFIELDNSFFSYILSPSIIEDPKHIFCKKRKWLPLFPSKLKQWQLLNYRCVSFIKAFKAISHGKERIQVVVMDDILLLEAFALLKCNGKSFDLIFSFHGHSLKALGDWGVQVNKILFLTNLGYMETLQAHHDFTPLVSVVGNGVSSDEFYPLSLSQKNESKKRRGLDPDSKVLIWLSNNRPKKGFHLFKQVVKNLLEKYSKLQVWIIGIDEDAELRHDRINFFGKIPNDQLPSYLQMGDFYMFTSLWKEGFGLTMVEAAKCGNQIIASRVGGIPEVVSGMEGVYLIDFPNRAEFWEVAFEQAWQKAGEFVPDNQILNDFHDLRTWMLNFKNALVY